MNQFIRRLSHFAKVVTGNFISRFLRHLFLQRKGSASRLHQSLSSSQSLSDYSIKVLIKPTSILLCEPKFFNNESTEEKHKKMLINSGSYVTRPAGIISVNNIDISFPIGMHLWKGKILEDVLLGEQLLVNPKYVLDLETIPFRNKKAFFSEAILLSLPWYHNFFHWMIEILPRLILYDLAEDIHNLNLLVPRSSPRFIRESLKLTGYEDKVSFIEDGVYRFERLHLLTRLAVARNVSPFAIEWLNRKIPNIETSQKRRIYVSRADAKIRYIINELEIQNILSDFGFETVIMSQYTLAKQIKIFQQAEIVVGSHGAAFAHIAFMMPESIFIEIFESCHFNPCYYRIASLKKLKYGFLVGQKHGFGLSIDVVKLKTLLEEAIVDFT